MVKTTQPADRRHQMLWRGGGREKRQMKRQRERRSREDSHREKGWFGRNHEEPERYITKILKHRLQLASYPGIPMFFQNVQKHGKGLDYCPMSGKETVGMSLLQHGHQTLYPLCPQRSFQTLSWWRTLPQCSSCELGGSTGWTGQTRLMGCGPVALTQLQ